VRSAGLVVSVDNGFTVYLNNQLVFTGTDWTKLSSAPIDVKKGENQLLLVAENGTTSPNPAGAFAAIRIVYEDGSDEVIATDDSWTVSTKVPAGNKPGQWKIAEMTWEKAVPLPSGPWSATIDPQVGKSLAAASAFSPMMVRASLLKSDFLMRSLGRPNRDQIVTSRPNELTTLEAIDLSNDATLAKALETGTAKFLADHGDSPDHLAEQLYLTTLTRLPTDEERTVLREILGEKPDAQTVADLTWAILMMPEYLLVR